MPAAHVALRAWAISLPLLTVLAQCLWRGGYREVLLLVRRKTGKEVPLERRGMLSVHSKDLEIASGKVYALPLKGCPVALQRVACYLRAPICP